MKKLIYTAALMLATITISYAQTGKRTKLSDDARAEKMTAMLQEKLSLTDDQKAKVKTIEVERIKKGEEWRKSDAEARKAAMEQRKTFMKDQQAKIEQVLTAEQKDKLKAFRDETKQKMKERKDKHGKRFGGKRSPKQ